MMEKGLWLTTALVVTVLVYCNTVNGTSDRFNEKNDDVILVEKDILITIDDLRKNFDLDESIIDDLRERESLEHDHHVNKRAALSDDDELWLNREVHYVITKEDPNNPSFTLGFNELQIDNIMAAIKAWSDVTCLKFIDVEEEVNRGSFRGIYAKFVKDNFLYGECSSYVGRQFAGQPITLSAGSWCVGSIGVIMHEIGHALGLWHEQSRPDRDSYVKIKDAFTHDITNLGKRRDEVIDYRGTKYDYSSIMHYSDNTLEVINIPEYNRQGRPILGDYDRGLSPIDILQVNRMYKCPAPGLRRALRVNIHHGFELRGYEPSTYVEVKAVNAMGEEAVLRTSTVEFNNNPMWNESLTFGYGEWQFIRLRLWNETETTSMSETVPVREHSASVTLTYCTNTPAPNETCDTSIVYYSYDIGCYCFNGGTCVDEFEGPCLCPGTHTGDRCQYVQRELKVYVTYHETLPNDNDCCQKSNREDLNTFLKVVAYHVDGTKYTDGYYLSDEGEYVTEFDVNPWHSFKVIVEHRSHTFSLIGSNYKLTNNIRLKISNGYIDIDYDY